MKLSNLLKSRSTPKEGPTFSICERLGQGHVVSDMEFLNYVSGRRESFSGRRFGEVGRILSQQPWLDEVLLARAHAKRGDLFSNDQVFAKRLEEALSHERGIQHQDANLEDYKVNWWGGRRMFLTASGAAVIVVVALFVLNSLRNPLPSDVAALAQLSTSHLNEADAWLGVTRDPNFGVEQVQPVGEVTTSLRPTLTWKVTSSRVRVQKISLFLGNETGGKLVMSISRPIGTVWIRDEDLAPGSRYTWTVEFEVDDAVIRRSARFRTPSPEALSYLQGTSKGLDRMQEFAILVELQRYQQALPLLSEVLRDGQLTDAERVRLRELSERLRVALTRQE